MPDKKLSKEFKDIIDEVFENTIDMIEQEYKGLK